MDLDLTDRRLLLEIDRAPVAPLAEIAHTLGVGERTVSRRFTRLREEGLIRVLGRTRPGVGGRDLFLARVRTDAATAGALAARLARLPGTRWVRLSRDGSEIICALTAGEDETSALHLLPRNPQVHRVETCEILQEGAVDSLISSRKAGRPLSGEGPTRDTVDVTSPRPKNTTKQAPRTTPHPPPAARFGGT